MLLLLLSACTVDTPEKNPSLKGTLFQDRGDDTSSSDDTEDTSSDQTNGQEYTKIYVTVVMHSEQPTNDESSSSEYYYPDYSSSESTFNDARAGLLDMVEMLKEEQVKFDFQPDSNFLEAVKKYDSGTDDTDGENILKYIVSQGFEIDAHHHPSFGYSYADVAYLDKELTGTDSGVIGGFIFYPIEDSELEEYSQPIQGTKYSYTWQPKILWGGGVAGHQTIDGISDVEISGIWRPKSAEDFFDDKEGNLPDVGSYVDDKEGVLDLLEKADAGELDPSKMYTANLMNNHRSIDGSGSEDESYISNLQQDIEEIKAADTNNRIVWVTITEAVDIWEQDYNSEPNLYYADGYTGF